MAIARATCQLGLRAAPSKGRAVPTGVLVCVALLAAPTGRALGLPTVAQQAKQALHEQLLNRFGLLVPPNVILYRGTRKADPSGADPIEIPRLARWERGPAQGSEGHLRPP